MITWFVILSPTWPNSRRRAWILAHLAVRQQAAVGVGAGPTAPCLSGGSCSDSFRGAMKETRAAGAAGADPPSHRPPLPPKSGPGARAGLWRPEPLQLGGKVLVGWDGGLGSRLFFLLVSFFRVCATASWQSSRLRRDGRRCFFIFCPLPLFLLAGTRGEEGTNVVLLFFLKLRKKRKLKLIFVSIAHS